MKGVHPHATDAEQAAFRSSLEQRGTNYIKDTLQQWLISSDVNKQVGAQQILGFMTIKGMLRNRPTTAVTGPERDKSGRIVPEKAPKSIHALLNAGQKDKLSRLADRVKRLFSIDFFCRSEWPQFDGIFVTLNELKNNEGGTGYQDVSLKKRDVTQINVLAASDEALQRFHKAFDPTSIDDTALYEYFETTDSKKYVNRFKNVGEDEN